MKIEFIERFLTSAMMFNFENKFKNYINRIIIDFILSSFEKINNDLSKIDRMNIHDTQTFAFRAKIVNDDNQENDKKNDSKSKSKSKNIFKNEFNLEVKCEDCDKSN